MSINPFDLYWLPDCPDWNDAISRLRSDESAWPELVRLARTRMDFVRTNQLDRLCLSLLSEQKVADSFPASIRLAVMGSSTVANLLPGLRIAALRHGLRLSTYVPAYGQYQQELLDPSSPLHRFSPDVILFALDSRHVIGQVSRAGEGTATSETLEWLLSLWHRAQEAFSCHVLQQTLLPVFPPLIGNNEYRLSLSRSRRVDFVNEQLRIKAQASGVDLLALDAASSRYGVGAWYSETLWHRAKQEIHPTAGPLYGEMVARLIAAQRGRSSKCLVLDLDNTLWGGVIGDDGLDGIVLGQGSPLGEAYLEFQTWIAEQAKRGIILAVCSKNDEANAVLPFESHPEMKLEKSRFSVFVANWSDKATNIRTIAERLNIGLDSLVFVDDSPFERDLVRRELPMVAVPELPTDPAFFAQCVSDAGYFEALAVTLEDLQRTELYQANRDREMLQATSTNLDEYLVTLKMELVTSLFDELNLKRIVQLINKTNQFNLTTRRYSEDEVVSVIEARDALGLHFRLTDSFGDNGIIAAMIGRFDEHANATINIDTWLMSCRVMGRGVEYACLNAFVAYAAEMGASEIAGKYIPTAKNGMVRELYARCGFQRITEDAGGNSSWRLQVPTFMPLDTTIKQHRVEQWTK